MGLHTDEHTAGRFLTVVAGKLREKLSVEVVESNLTKLDSTKYKEVFVEDASVDKVTITESWSDEEDTIIVTTTTPPHATKRSGEVAGSPFEKWELVYPGITAFITKVELQDGKYGKNVLIHMTDANDEQFTVSLGAENSRTGVPFMMALPNIDLTKEVTLKPYKFDNDKGENVEGLKITQGETVIKSAFYDPEKKENLRGMPKPDVKKNGEVNWKLYFAQRDEWLQEYMVEQGFITVGEPYQAEGATDATDDDKVDF